MISLLCLLEIRQTAGRRFLNLRRQARKKASLLQG